LPALRKTVFSAAAASGGAKFFQTHGAKLRELTLSESQIVHSELAIWRNCPALTVLGVACDEKVGSALSLIYILIDDCALQHPVSSFCFTTSDVHACLERIVFVTPQYRYETHSIHQTTQYTSNPLQVEAAAADAVEPVGSGATDHGGVPCAARDPASVLQVAYERVRFETTDAC
jgi:hypothetical protein